MNAEIILDDGTSLLVELPIWFTFQDGSSIILPNNKCGVIRNHRVDSNGLKLYVSRYISAKEIRENFISNF